MFFPYNKSATLGTSYTLTSLSYIILLARVILRRLRQQKFQLDDYLTALAAAFYGLSTASCAIVVWNGKNIYVEDSRKLTMNEVQHLTLGSKWALAGRPFYLSYLWTLKACMLLYYTRLLSEKIELLALKCTAAFLGLTWVACMITFFVECRFIELYWQVLPETPACAKAPVAAIMLEATNLSTDILILIIPLPMILHAELGIKPIVQLGCLFVVGLYVIAISIMRLILTAAHITEQNRIIWAEIECFAATIAVNAPIIYGLWRNEPYDQKSSGRQNSIPGYTLNIQRATTLTVNHRSSGDDEDDEQQWNEGDELHPIRENGVRDGIRKSIRKISDKVRRSLELIEIQRHTEIVQDTKAEDVESGLVGEPGGMDTFFGSGPIAHISTKISTNSGSSRGAKSNRFRRLKRMNNAVAAISKSP